MAFTSARNSKVSFDSPEALFRDIRHRKVEGLLSHQADLLRKYHPDAMKHADVAVELPTGSGKTLVGLLIAEFRRVVEGERVVYLCPTRQLVRQVVAQSEEKYGIKATAFVGRIRDYSPSDKAKYQTAQTIAVATYSALFNTNPFFSSPQLIVLDDAHAAENYISSAWSLNIDRKEYSDIYSGLLHLCQPMLTSTVFHRFTSSEPDSNDLGWVEKIPTPDIASIVGDLSAFLDTHVAETQLQYPWRFLRDHLDACHLFVSYSGILIRPFIPPSLTHAPFAGASQRLYMSATLGRGGDLERITGVKPIHRIPIPPGWDRQGIGRRFFMFPGLSLEDDKIDDLIVRMMSQAHRSLVLVPRDSAATHYSELVSSRLKYPVFAASDIEDSKRPFTEAPSAVAVLANRYDGIDLIGDECRLLFIRGLPKASNIQERFMMSRLGAGALLDDRIRTRIVQAIGRCTRSPTDYAAVCVLGDDFYDWLVLEEKRSLFHPELQAELAFGSTQSLDKSESDFVENLGIFLEHGDSWSAVDGDILDMRSGMAQSSIPGQAGLYASAPLEVDYVYAMWDHNYERAAALAQEAAAALSNEDTKGFRGWWYYLAGSAADSCATLLAKEHFRELSTALFGKAAACTMSIPWLRRLASSGVDVSSGAVAEHDEFLEANAEAIELLFDARGYASPVRFERDMREIQQGLQSSDPTKFEAAHVRLGSLLGFAADNSSADATPDPWWVSGGKLCIVSEDKSDSNDANPIAPKHARQAATHAAWITANISLPKDAQVFTVMITPATTIHPDAATFAPEVGYWNLKSFREWATAAMQVMRELRSQYSGVGSLLWRGVVCDTLRTAHLDPLSIVARVQRDRIADLPKDGGRSKV